MIISFYLCSNLIIVLFFAPTSNFSDFFSLAFRFISFCFVILFLEDVCTKEMTEARTIDGTCNDLTNTTAGSRFYRFGRNVPLKHVYNKPEDLLKPNPRTLAKK